MIASARHVNVDGKVTGDLIVLTERLIVRGEVEGNVIALARRFELRGVVKGAVHVASCWRFPMTTSATASGEP